MKIITTAETTSTPTNPNQPSRPPDLQVFLTVAEVAKALRTSEGVVRGLCQDGTLRSFRVRNRYRIHADSVAHLVG